MFELNAQKRYTDRDLTVKIARTAMLTSQIRRLLDKQDNLDKCPDIRECAPAKNKRKIDHVMQERNGS